MAMHKASNRSRLLMPAVAALAALSPALVARSAEAAAKIVVTPGEQNTQSGENGCDVAPCQNGHWLHYPELIQVALGADYAVQNNGDGGAVLGCDTTTAAVAGGNSFCASNKYTASVASPPDIVIIGPFGEHDQRIVGASANNEAMLYDQTVFQNAYEGLVQKYLAYTSEIYMMTPIDVPWGGTPTLPNGEDLVKDKMLPAALAVAQAHHLTVIDTYTAISGTPDLVTQYYGSDGQVTSAGQQKMADLIVAAIQATENGGAGGTDAGAPGGSAGEGGASAGAAGESGAGGSGGVVSGGASGETGGSSETAGSSGAGESSGGAVSSGGGGSAGEEESTAGTTGGKKKHSSGGCALTGEGDSNWGAGVALLSLGLIVVARKRAAS